MGDYFYCEINMQCTRRIHFTLLSDTKATSTFFWSSVILMLRQVKHAFSESMGKLGKSISNSNGEDFLEYAMQNNLVITNTLFPHKMAHRTIWTSHGRVEDQLLSDGTSRRNTYRNPIDYVVCKSMHKIVLQKSRSYGETGRKLITNWLELLLTWTRGEWSKSTSHLKESTSKVNGTSNQTTLCIRTQWQTTEEQHVKCISEWSLENNFKNLQRNYQRSLKNQRSKLEAIKIKESAKIIIKTKKLRVEAESKQNKQQRQQLKNERKKTTQNLWCQF